MRIGVVSDTHRNTELLSSVVSWLVEEQHAAQIYHLGDDYEDVKVLADMYLDVVQVPGVYHQGYRDGTLEPRELQTVQGLRIMLVHSTERDLGDDDLVSADVVLHGHTHHAEIRIDDGRLFFNPGHLKSEMDKHEKASFGLLDIQDSSVTATIFDLAHEEVERVQMVRSENGLYKAT